MVAAGTAAAGTAAAVGTSAAAGTAAAVGTSAASNPGAGKAWVVRGHYRAAAPHLVRLITCMAFSRELSTTFVPKRRVARRRPFFDSQGHEDAGSKEDVVEHVSFETLAWAPPRNLKTIPWIIV